MFCSYIIKPARYILFPTQFMSKVSGLILRVFVILCKSGIIVISSRLSLRLRKKHFLSKVIVNTYQNLDSFILKIAICKSIWYHGESTISQDSTQHSVHTISVLLLMQITLEYFVQNLLTRPITTIYNQGYCLTKYKQKGQTSQVSCNL